MNNKSFFPFILSLVLCSFPLAAYATSLPGHVKGVTAVTRVFGDGQKVSAVVLEYDRAIQTQSLDIGDFQVTGKTIARVYANTLAQKATHGQDGPFVILELENVMVPAKGFGGPPPDGAKDHAKGPNGFSGPKLGQKSDKPAQSPPMTVSVVQKGDILTRDGQTYGADSRVLKSTRVVNPVVDDFQQRVYKDPKYAHEPLMYNLFVPAHYDPSKTYPLVLFMHDAGVVSNNPTETLTQGLGAVAWATPASQARHECFVLAPQYDCVIVGDGSKTTKQVDMTVDLIRALIKEYRIDPARIYNTGQSMGGMTSIAMDIQYPDLFAASFLVACQWDASLVGPMAGKPLWIIVSQGDTKASPGQDQIVGVLEQKGARVCRAVWDAQAGSAALEKEAAAMRQKGCQINYTTFKDGNHRYTWQYAYSIQGVRDWLFEQKKGK